MEGAAAAGETMTMRDRIRIYVLVVALALSIAVAPAQASPDGDHGAAAVGWWDAVVDALAELFGLDAEARFVSTPPAPGPPAPTATARFASTPTAAAIPEATSWAREGRRDPPVRRPLTPSPICIYVITTRKGRP